jgi:signal transduction histidine kinase
MTEESLIRATGEQVVPALYSAFDNPAPDPEAIEQMLVSTDQLGAAITARDLVQVGQIELLVRTSADIDLALVDADGVLLGTSDPDMVLPTETGLSLDSERMPDATGPLQAALAGETDPEALVSATDGDDLLVWAVPVFDGDPVEGDVLGAVIVRLDSAPTGGDLLLNTLTVIARGLLFAALAAALIGGVFGSLTAEGMVTRFARLRVVTEAWSRGDFSRFVHDPTGDELSLLGRHLNTMAVQLEELLKQNQQMAIADERNRLARELHDSAKQQALAASFQLGTAITLFGRDPGTARKHLLEADHLIDSVRLELTDLIHELRPPNAEERSLSEMIDQYAVEWAHQNAIKAELTLTAGDDLVPDIRKAIYRITQEALANVARHSGATAVVIRLAVAGDRLALTISDDGRGFDPQAPHAGLGLHSMRERVQSLDGDFHVDSEPGRGATVSAMIPLAQS